MAVYTDVSDAEVTAFVAEYDLGEVLSFKGIAEGVENSNYLLTTERGNFILTLYETRVNPEDLPFFVGLMEHLARSGFSCPTPVHGSDGIALRRLCGRPPAIVTFLDGLWPRNIMPFHCSGLGDVLARLHEASRGFAMTRPNSLTLAGWRSLVEATRERAHEIEPGLADELATELRALERDWPTGLPAGICHADLFPDNVFFRDRHVTGVIDFYFACTDFFAYDVAICLNAWCFEPDFTWNRDKARLLLDAYQAVRPLSADERAAMALLARGSALRFLLTRLYDWLNRKPGALVRPKDPREYLAKLRFHRQADAGTYGL